jgi:hypothetical protein
MKTHWKKNIDSRYISGEDMQSGLRGLRPEMMVKLTKSNDATTFDKQKNEDIIKTALWLTDLKTGNMIYKPAILNTTNAQFFIKEFGSEYIEDWQDKPVIMYAKPDKRHGYVVRFKSAPKQLPELNPNHEKWQGAKQAIKDGNVTIAQIKAKYTISANNEKLLTDETV